MKTGVPNQVLKILSDLRNCSMFLLTFFWEGAIIDKKAPALPNGRAGAIANAYFLLCDLRQVAKGVTLRAFR